jgi:hypothetical protein
MFSKITNYIINRFQADELVNTISLSDINLIDTKKENIYPLVAILFNENHISFKKNGVENCMRTPELEDNHAIHNLWKHLDPEYHKKRCTFIKELK